MNNTQKVVGSGLLVAIGVLLGSNFYIPIGVAKAFPIQHLINVIAAVIFGPAYAVMCAFGISLLRNMMGTGSLLAFPGSMIGAFLAGIFYLKTRHHLAACLGEVIGTGIIGSIVAYPMAKWFLGMDNGAFYFVIPFALSSVVGALLGLLMLKTLLRRLPVRPSKHH
ncbi:energy coupling factor transporter S component ThiW [Fusibacter paucivorans]|uniref:Energy coupling factor transporter S component ThiW n=1 Tax=Fusibacter paucivorans TaxID=76009 RepID=A0ABS5PLA1_9FIRM|nr:energy coupling factor transporter S component ThiW [Fusibacter paucivorans]MBS7525913.1 energy coupling factor transporter S component ThiW [Fusibacter paucivorans]